MKTVRLHMDHREHKNGKIIHHKAGSVVELPDDVADYISSAVRDKRMQDRITAASIPGTPEFKAEQ
jgi:hypothetical protein